MKRIKLLSLIVVFAVLFVGLGTISSQAQVFEHYKTLKDVGGMGISTLSFSPDGRYLASGSWDLTVTLWDVNSGQEIKNVQGGDYELYGKDCITYIDWENDGNRFTSGSSFSYNYIVWEVNTWKKIKESFGNEPYGYQNVVFDYHDLNNEYRADGVDNDVIISTTYKRETIQTLQGHSELVSSVKFSEDGKYLASGSVDGTIIIWKQKEVNKKPSARIDKVWVEHNVQRTGIQQVYDYYWNRYIDTPYTYTVMRIHIDFTVDYKLNEKIRVCAFFYDRYGNKLTTSNNEYKTILGQLTVQSECTPIYEGCHWSDFVLEIPNSVIQRGENNYFYIEIQDSDNNNNSLVNSEYIYFSVH